MHALAQNGSSGKSKGGTNTAGSGDNVNTQGKYNTSSTAVGQQ